MLCTLSKRDAMGSSKAPRLPFIRSVALALHTSVWILLATAPFEGNAILVNARMEAASPHSLLRHGTAMEDRQLFDLPSSFDFYDGACSSSCGNVADGNLTPFLNTCPKCPVKYNAQHCNHCCQDGASSLQLRWHRCPGSFVLATNAQASEDCSIKEESLSAADGVRFIDCSCYDGINKPAKFNPSSCTLSDSITLKSTKSRTSDICIVSVADTVEGIAIDFSKPLPSVIGLVLTAPVGEDTTSPLWNPYPLTTYFDTTCKSIHASTAPYVLPIFPGYGKFPNTCPSAGFIDLETTGTPFLPAGVDHFDGRPPTESFWFEFVDGTSTAFWPQQGPTILLPITLSQTLRHAHAPNARLPCRARQQPLPQRDLL